MKLLRGPLWLLMVLASGLAAQAAKIEVEQIQGLNIISVEGELILGDDKIFDEKVRGINDGLVAFASSGGSLIAGIGIGKTIRDNGLNTLVGDDDLCASACALAWLGGKTRFAGSKAKIAFHAAWKLKGGEKVETGAGNALVGAYLYSLGLRDKAIVYATQAPPMRLSGSASRLPTVLEFRSRNLAPARLGWRRWTEKLQPHLRPAR